MEWEADPDLYPPYLRARIKRGLGMGSGTSYRPWKNIQNTGTKGTAACVHGISIDRRYEFLDERAKTYFLLIERSTKIVDIRESWPILDIGSTLRLSQEFDVTHPRHDIFPEPLSVDFLITEADSAGVRYRAVALVDDSHRMGVRNQRLNQVQQQWCNDHNIDWTLAETSQLDRTVLDALRFVRAWYRHRYVPDLKTADSFAESFMDQYQNNLVLEQLIESARKKLRIRADTALDVFRFCAWSHRIPISLTDRIAKNCPVVLRKVENQPAPGAKPHAGMVLRMTENGETRFLRLTHLFTDCAYVMWVMEPNEVRNARRPHKLTLGELDRLEKTANAT